MRIGINGLGRIGRLTLRAALERGRIVAAINTSTPIDQLAHLIKYDSTHGKAPFDIAVGDNFLEIDGQKIQVLSHKTANEIPWHNFGIDVVLECSGRLNSKDLAAAHLQNGVKKVVVSAPCADADATIILGVNDETLTSVMDVISIGSCTTNALAPIVKILNQVFGIESGYATTIHSYTFDQNLLDNFHTDIRRARSAASSMIPTKSGITSALKQVLPEIGNRISGSAIRVPTPNVSLVDFSFKASKPTDVSAVNSAVQDAANSAMKNILSVAAEPLVSIDFNHNPFSSIFDPFETQVIQGDFVRVLCWYDNEWGFANRMVDIIPVLIIK
jgi:glyceraldehyde 3-phosphate dehydrogenase